MKPRPRRTASALVALAAVGIALAACDGGTPTRPVVHATSASPARPDPSPSGPGSASPAAAALVAVPEVDVRTEEVATGLAAPWGIAALADGRLLVTLRDEARIVLVDPATGKVTDVTGPGADDLRENTVPQGEGGLLGIAVGPPGSATAGEVFVYRTGADGNAVLRGSFDPGASGASAAPVLGSLTEVLGGIPSASNHDGGRLAFGPDGFLYVGTGDASDTANSQDPGSLGGKILRITAGGDPAPGNPDPASPVWSLGHRNVQGLGWDATGRMLASEFGQNTWDELNVVVPGGNYGWPDVEGAGGGGEGFVDPVVTWPTDQASPSGIAVTREGVYLAALRGERLWRVPFAGDTPGAGFAEPQMVLDGYGRLRAVYADPANPPSEDGTSVLYVLTNNTDGRGDPRDGDDRLLRVTVTPGG